MIRERIAHRIRPYMPDGVLGGLSLGASLVFYSGIEEYLYGRYGFPSGMLVHIAGVFAQLWCMLALPLAIFVHLVLRCRKDGVRGMAIRAAVIAATLAPMFLLVESAAVTHCDKMLLRGFAARVRSQGADVAAIREWQETARPPVGDIESPDWPSALKALGPPYARVLEDGCIELEWFQVDGPRWGVIIAPTEHFLQEEYRLRMAAGMYTVVGGNGIALQYPEYMVQLSPGVYAWLRPVIFPPATFPSEGG